MEADVTPDTGIKIGAAGTEEIVQNVATILKTRKGSVPMDRDFGTEWHFVDQPTPKAAAAIRADIARTVHKYEDRARVKQIVFAASGLSALTPKVRIEILSG